MMNTTKFVTVLAASTCLWAVSHASAADLPPIYSTPIYEAAPELQPVEIGNGWYLRGDVGYAFESETDSQWTVDRWNPTFNSRFAQGQHDGAEIDGGAEVTVGAGYRFTDYVRADVTATRFETEATFNVDEFEVVRSADITAWQVMANAYVDLGTFVGLTPYVGGGVGSTHLKFEDNTCSYAGGGCDFGGAFRYASQETDDWRFTYSLMAGVSYDVSQNLKLDVGYRFSDIEGGQSSSATFTELASRDEYRLKHEDDGFERHAISVGLRYSLW
ncbi:outer membrane protein [Fulvimarina sp. 2208YS6-2-32]|uniref:Outer membrane protein n=1 Tax=Fulvimarina uroteuthidis TaxID=3098149 RepID=A0ABU5I5T2_9HYPH|nr:outer membrane protein [Fulvimarina sp. 2208YS6-2-32]MDY8110734.1 outer membrane protein [Fulvimarina sp. 2208YS6-2-32]